MQEHERPSASGPLADAEAAAVLELDAPHDRVAARHSGRQQFEGAVGLELAPQPPERTRTRRADAADRQLQRGRDLAVARRVLVEQHPQELLIRGTQPLERPPQLGVARGGHQLRVHRRVVDAAAGVVRGDLSCSMAQDTQALAAGGRGEPAADVGRIAQVVDVLEQAQPGLLRDVGGVGLVEVVGAGDARDQVAELLDEPGPGQVVARGGGVDELQDALAWGREVRVRVRRGARRTRGDASARANATSETGSMVGP